MFVAILQSIPQSVNATWNKRSNAQRLTVKKSCLHLSLIHNVYPTLLFNLTMSFAGMKKIKKYKRAGNRQNTYTFIPTWFFSSNVAYSLHFFIIISFFSFDYFALTYSANHTSISAYVSNNSNDSFVNNRCSWTKSLYIWRLSNSVT